MGHYSIKSAVFFYRVGIIAACITAGISVISCAPSERHLLERQQGISSDDKFVRVLLKKTRDAVRVHSDDKIKITDPGTGKFRFYDAGKTLVFRPETVKSRLEIESWKKPLSVDGVKYRGTFELQTVAGQLYVINPVKMDEYLFGVVPSEMPPGWSIEALKAQAVAARTYAYYHILRNQNQIFDLDATTNNQVYKGLSAETPDSNRAVADTSGEVVTHGHHPILSYFHSTCGGMTTGAGKVWDKNDFPYLQKVACPFCAKSPKMHWEYRLGIDEIKKALRRDHGIIHSVKGISLKKHEGRVVSVIIRHENGTVRLTGNQFRLLISPYNVKSLLFDAEKIRGGLMLTGKGWGHGVGMCQYGAKGMAEQGRTYSDILRFYYRGTEIISVDKSRSGGSGLIGRIERQSSRKMNSVADE